MVAKSACSKPGATSVARRVIGVSVQVGHTELTLIQGAHCQGLCHCQNDLPRPCGFWRVLTGGLGNTRDGMLACGVLTGLSQHHLGPLIIPLAFSPRSSDLGNSVYAYTMLKTAMVDDTEDKLTIDPRVVPRAGSVALACWSS